MRLSAPDSPAQATGRPQESPRGGGSSSTLGGLNEARSPRPAPGPGGRSLPGHAGTGGAAARLSLPGARRRTDLERCFRICFLIIPAMASAGPRPSRRPAGTEDSPHPSAFPFPRRGDRREREPLPPLSLTQRPPPSWLQHRLVTGEAAAEAVTGRDGRTRSHRPASGSGSPGQAKAEVGRGLCRPSLARRVPPARRSQGPPGQRRRPPLSPLLSPCSPRPPFPRSPPPAASFPPSSAFPSPEL